ncbi:hypothetical protein [Pseudanabaena sp. FACHB-2040]|uniref:hypothetical protein n=1 Tax=Pseudanabaena sp. FACHB-2040 TaxID=2692859 RepID=UPI0016864C75|nr:hypothetical protein [Pseudanabaena sp. FACHB-2040]MBD2256199.1 hypothetical protein [Pseudanabaena sp. FACHB-2040]
MFVEQFVTMKTDYYPWNTQALIDWLNVEGRKYQSPKDFAVALGVPRATLQLWTRNPLPTITLEQLYALSKYRRCSLDATLQWLEISSMHLDLLANEIAD